MYEAINSSIFLVTLLTAEPSLGFYFISWFLPHNFCLSNLESKLLNVLNLIYDTKKQLFSNEKFDTNASIDGLKDYCLLFSKLNLLVPYKETFDFR